MTLSAKASQAAAEYIATLATEFAPEVVDEFREEIMKLDQDKVDRSKEALALIDDHDADGEPRTMDAWLTALGADGGGQGDPDSGPAGGAEDTPEQESQMADKKPAEGNTMKKPGAAAPAGKPGKPGEDHPAPLAHKHGDLVHFEHGDEEAGVTVRGKGRIVASGADGVTVQTDDGREHKVRHKALRPAKSGTMKKAAAPLLIFTKSMPAAPAARASQSVPDTGALLLLSKAAYVGPHTRVSKNGVVSTISPHLENRHPRPESKEHAVPKAGDHQHHDGKHRTDAQELLAEARKREAAAHEKHDEALARHDKDDDQHHYGDKDGLDADGKPRKKRKGGDVRKADIAGVPLVVFGLAVASAADSAAPAGAAEAPADPSGVAGNPPAPPAPEPEAKPAAESLADPRASYTQRAIQLFRNLWNPSKGAAT